MIVITIKQQGDDERWKSSCSRSYKQQILCMV
nr:MAG TPA: hypothetical protein [Caudoviricetes sp.]